MNYHNLPYRRNCEAYLQYKNKVIVRDTGLGYLEFPGGGIDNQETPKEAISREIVEETGALVGRLQKIKVLRFDWGPRWAKTAKQKERYRHFRGEEMHLFTGTVKRFGKAAGDRREPGWKGAKTMPIVTAIRKLQALKPFPKEMKQYYETQLEQLRLLQRCLKERASK